jgi:hypothetical protein
MTWLMSTAQGWRLVCAESDFVDFRLYFCGVFRSQLAFSAQAGSNQRHPSWYCARKVGYRPPRYPTSTAGAAAVEPVAPSAGRLQAARRARAFTAGWVQLAGCAAGRAAEQIAPTHHTPASSSSWQVNGYTPPVDAMRMYPRYYASRGGQCASGALLGGLGGQLLAEKGQVGLGWSMALT